MKKVFILFFFLYFQYSNSQHSLFNELFTAFDSFNQPQLNEILNNTDESQIPKKTKQDSILFSIYSVIKFSNTDLNTLRSDEWFENEYRRNLNFLIKNNSENFLPYFFNHYAAIFSFDKKYYKYCRLFTDNSIEIEKKGLNKSHVLSSTNLFDAYNFRDILRSVYDDNYKYEDLIALIKHYENNKSQLTYISNELLFKKYYKAAEREDISDSLRFTYFKETFEYGKKIEKLPNLYDYRSLLSLLRSLSKKTNSYEVLNHVNTNCNNLFSKTNYLINACYINNYDKNSFYALESYVKGCLSDNTIFNKDEIFDITMTLWGFSIKVGKEMLNIKRKDSDYILWSRVYKLYYQFILKYGELSRRYEIVKDIISFIKNHGQEIDGFELEKLKKEKHDMIYNLLVNNQEDFKLNPYDFIEFFKYRTAYIYYPNWTEIEMDTDFLKLFDYYKKNISYEDLVKTLKLYLPIVQSIMDYSYKKIDKTTEFNSELSFIKRQLNDNISNIDIDLRIELAKLEELPYFTQKIKELEASKDINIDKHNLLTSKILYKKATLTQTKEDHSEFYNHYIDHIDAFEFQELFNYAIGTAIDFKFNYGFVELSNQLLTIYNGDYKNRNNSEKLTFELIAGFYYKYLDRKNLAINFFLSARANDYHWNDESYDYNSLTRDNTLCFEIFDIYLKQNNLEKAYDYYNNYLESYNFLVDTFSESESKTVKIDPNSFYELERKALDMKRRLLLTENKYVESEKVIDTMILLENEKPYYGKFNLSMLKYGSQVSQNKWNNDVFLSKLDSIYSANNVSYDDQYFGYKKQFGVISMEILEIALAKLKAELNKVEIIKKLSYENQVYLMLDLGNKMNQLEHDFFLVTNNSSKALEQLIDYKLKIDDLDRYNTGLLNMNNSETQTYFDLLNKRFVEKDFDKLSLIINEFDVFQQKQKIGLSTNSIETISLTNFQEKLKQNQAYIRFTKLNDDDYFAYLIGLNFVEIISLEKSGFNKIADYYTSKITNKEEDTYSYNLLLRPILDALPETVNELFIKNEGIYNNINVEALWDPQNKTYLFDKFKISIIERPSAIFKLNELTSLKTAFLFGNPNFYEERDSLTYNNSTIRSGINPLPYTEREVNTLNTILKNNGIDTITTNMESSTEEAIYSNSVSDIIHIATHGFFIEGSQTDRFNWGLLASGAKNSIQNDFKKEYRNDGIIFGSEIILKNFTKTELVVLSACETGYGTSGFFGGENLANTFLRAGAKNVISTLWPIDDAITKEFMTVFYSELMYSKNINLSLLKAKQTIKDRYSHPFYWAPFIVVQNKI